MESLGGVSRAHPLPPSSRVEGTVWSCIECQGAVGVNESALSTEEPRALLLPGRGSSINPSSAALSPEGQEQAAGAGGKLMSEAGQLFSDEMEHPCFIPTGTNSSQTRTQSFFLGGFPAWGTTQVWSAVPLCSTYLLALLGNLTVLSIIRAEQSLHAPMYLLLAMLAVADLGLSTSTFPTMLKMLWLETREISFSTCLTQMFFIHSFTDIESAVILAMAFDRYVAICHPLQYSSILTNSVTTKICVVIVLRTTLVQFPLPVLLTCLCFTRVSELSHPYCLHPDIIKHAGSDMRINSAYGLFVLLSTLGLDLLFVLLSYLLIFKTILNFGTWRERLKALNTCISHICAVLLFFIPMICLSMMHRFGKHVSPQAYVFMANLHFLAPPILNPIVYSMKTKSIRRRLLRML